MIFLDGRFFYLSVENDIMGSAIALEPTSNSLLACNQHSSGLFSIFYPPCCPWELMPPISPIGGTQRGGLRGRMISEDGVKHSGQELSVICHVV